ncbi:MAG: hypothetical protein K6A73_03980 [Bacteroidales bacterium]|nr:hypothetical protein [Bacteroidales bacterium]
MKKKVRLKTIEQNEIISLYSICFENNDLSEFEKFLDNFKENAVINKDFQAIIFSLKKIYEQGALERFFRVEGKVNDNLCALSIDSRQLRLYCLRLSDQILVLGNGGIKTTKTYQEDNLLSGYVIDLQKFDKLLKEAEKSGKITVENNVIKNSDAINFEL